MKRNLVPVRPVCQPVIGQMLMLGDLLEYLAKLLQASPAVSFLLQQGKAHGPFALLAAMLAGQFIQAASNGLSQAKVALVQG